MNKFIQILILVLIISAPADRVLAAPPANFQSTQVVGSGLNGPTGFEFAPDGRIFILERTGAVKIYKNGVLLATPFVTLPSADTGDRGLTGIAFDPNFATNHFVYFYYTSSSDLHNRLVRYSAETDTATAGPVILYETVTPSEQLHIGGTVRFGADGKIYLSIGDNGYPPNAQDLSVPFGKIIRINPDGTIPTDNPFYGQAGKRGEIWAYGLRNPFRFQFDSQTGNMYEGDVGQETWEEVNRIVKGGNYGWPNAEGDCGACAYINPLYAYNHNGQSRAVSAGPMYRGGMFPSSYNGQFFFSDYAGGFIKTLSFNQAGQVSSVNDFDLSSGSVVDMKTAGDGSLYYVTYYPGRLYRISYSTTNQSPIASAGADTTKGLDPLTVYFTSAGSIDPNGDTLTYLWDFGDGSTSTSANPIKTFTIKGTYVVELTVSDGVNTAQATPIVIQVGKPPVLTIASPINGLLYNAGDTINYSSHAVDGAGFDLPEQYFTTEVLFHHGSHTHPFLGPIQSQSGNFAIPTSGEPSTDTWYEIKITATDTNGLKDTESVSIYPRISSFSVNSNPSPLPLTVDGLPVNTPTNINAVIGTKRELEAPTYQTLNNKFYRFVSWSDGGAQKHIITVGTSPQTYTASYVEDVNANFLGQYFSNKTLSGTPTLTRNDLQINFDWGAGSPDTAIPVDNFSARWIKTETFENANYKFSITGDDGVRLYIDNVLVIDKWIDQGPTTYTLDKDMSAGDHTIKVEYYENGGGATAKFSFVKNGGVVTPPPGTGYSAKYWNAGTGAKPNIPATAPTLTRTDNAINFDWGAGSPDATINADHFIAQWISNPTFESATYRFTLTADDGIRLYIDGILTLDKWIDQGPTTYTVDKLLTAGNHEIKVEYYENAGGAVAKMSYVKTTVTPPPTTGFNGEYFSNKTLSGTPTLTRNDLQINFDWGAGSPDTAIPVDNFSARWIKTETFENANYKFSITGDDGVRLYIDNVLVIDKWIDQGPTTYTLDKDMSAGDHTIKVEYYENGGGATAKFSFVKNTIAPPPPPATCPAQSTNAFTACYYSGMNFNNFLTTRVDNAINFDWGGGAPDVLVPVDNFSVRWSGDFNFNSGNYTFTATGDDGIKVYVDGLLIIDRWIDQGPTTYTSTQTLTAGTHNVRMEYYENGGGAVAKLNWNQVSSNPNNSIFTGEYYDNQNLSGAPKLTRQDANINFNWGMSSPDINIPADHFSARWIKQQNYNAGNYKFTVTADDGVRLYVDDVLVIDKWIDQPSTTYETTKSLTAGNHTIKLEYFDSGWDAIMTFGEIAL